jgi:hypothetical protein
MGLSSPPRFGLRASFDLHLAFQPSIDVLAHHISGETVALLDYTLKLVCLAHHLAQFDIAMRKLMLE